MLVIPLLATAQGAEEEQSASIDPRRLEAEQARIGKILLDKQNVFDLEDPEQNNALYRFLNRWHIMTRDSTITEQLLFSSGDVYSQRIIDESERILRGNRYLYDASIEPVEYRDGVVDLLVRTRDVWTLSPGLSGQRSGGENSWSVELEERNLFGRGHSIRLARSSDVDRDVDSFSYSDPRLRGTWVSLNLLLANSSDGRGRYVTITRPFYALDTRWAAGVSAIDESRISALYDLGERAAEYRHERRYLSVFGGRSAGWQDGWVRRYTAGIVVDENRFREALESTLPSAVPDDRDLVYPFVGIEILEDEFQKTTNRDQQDQTEDFFTGKRLTAQLGWADRSFGADRDALVYSASASRAYGTLERSALLLSASASGRFESGNTVNSLFSIDARYYRRQSEKRVFVASMSTVNGHDLDLDNPVEIGGTTGLRGYPLRYQSGHSKILVSLEQRYFTDWYPFKFVRVGGAVFFDAGRMWGDNPLGGNNLGWLRNVGLGLRLSPTRLTTRKILHVDLAFPLDGDESIDDTQIIVEVKRSF